MFPKMAHYNLNHHRQQQQQQQMYNISKSADGSSSIISRYKLTTSQWVLSIVLLSLLVICLAIILFISHLNYFEHTNNNNQLLSDDNNAADGMVVVQLANIDQRLRGISILEQQTPIAQFLGIPYANKPKRFRKSTLSPGWSGLKDALQWPSNCMQSSLHQYDYLTKTYNYQVSEDCLYLNVWTPLGNLPSQHNVSSQLLPVIIFIHGGGFSYMGISMEAYYGGVIAALGKVMLVTVNYRVGLFGFFNNQLEPTKDKGPSDDNEDGGEYHKNVGLYDQVIAIEWVKQNAIHFGGNPNQITLQGQSAGAISIGLHMISPISSGLFQRAILQSASSMMIKQMFGVSHFEQLIRLANCSQTSVDDNSYSQQDNVSTTSNPHNKDLESEYDDEDNEDYDEDAEDQDSSEDLIRRQTKCLEQLPASVLNSIQQQMIRDNAISFSPATPSQLLPEFADEVLRKANADFNGGLIHQKQVLLGANANESTLYLHHENKELFPLSEQRLANMSREQLTVAMRHLMGSGGQTEQFTKMVLDELDRNNQPNGTLVSKFFEFLSDFIFKGPVFKFGQMLSDDPNKRVYLYLFNQTVARYPEWIGSGHWVEMDFSFGMPLIHRDKFTDEDRELSTRMIRTWTHFARTGEMLAQFGLEWPKLDSNNYHHMSLQAEKASLGSELNMLYYRLFDIMYDSY